VTGLRRFVLLALAPALLLGCAAAAPTPYQPAVEGLGYSEQQLEGNRWRVTFTGNDATPRQTTDTYLLYRAAELTLRNDHDWFVIADQAHQLDGTGGISGPRVGIGYGSGSGIGIGVSTFLGGTAGSRYTASAEILMGDGEKPADDLNAYDALELAENLEPQIRRPAG
jgi:hypothetical protein